MPKLRHLHHAPLWLLRASYGFMLYVEAWLNTGMIGYLILDSNQKKLEKHTVFRQQIHQSACCSSLIVSTVHACCLTFQVILPFCAFFTGPPRFVGAWGLIILMMGIYLTGNWGQFNLGCLATQEVCTWNGWFVWMGGHCPVHCCDLSGYIVVCFGLLDLQVSFGSFFSQSWLLPPLMMVPWSEKRVSFFWEDGCWPWEPCHFFGSRLFFARIESRNGQNVWSIMEVRFISSSAWSAASSIPGWTLPGHGMLGRSFQCSNYMVCAS